MVLSARYGLKIASFSLWNEYFNSGLRGLARGHVTSVEACSRTKLFLQSEPGSVSKSIKFSKQYCSEANRKKEDPVSMIDKVKQEINGGSVSNPLMPRMNYVKKEMQVETRDEGELNVKEGDIINLSDLLFTKNRDYLVKYNDDQKVKADQLVGKAVLLYFVPVCFEISATERDWTTSLVDIYYDLLPKNDFEVIFVAVNNLCANYSSRNLQSNPQKNFEEIFSQMPWTAIPFSDIASRKRIARRFGISEWDFYCTVSYFIDSKGIVLTCNACPYIKIYGTQGYPFTEERIRDLDFEDDEAAKKPSLETLLGSPVRDYVISNKEDMVPIHTLKDKVVALYFYEDGLTDDEVTIKLKMAYNELTNKENFEVVLLYLYDTRGTLHSSNEESFWKTFKTMPWLALPFKDPNHKKLQRIFGYPIHLYGPEPVPTLVIFGPNGKFIDPCGADILIKFGIPAYPFTRKRLAKLETEKIKELKPNMLWDPNTVFRVKNDGSELLKLKLEMLWGPIMYVIVKHVLEFFPNFYPLLKLLIPDIKVPFSQFVGKRLLIYFEMDKYYNHLQKLQLMKQIYLRSKGTDDEFEVIYIKKSRSYNKHVADMPWLVHYYGEGYSLPKKLGRSFFKFNNCHRPERIEDCLLLAFERDGSIVRKTFDPTFDNMAFPFCAGGLEKEFLDQLNSAFGWYYWEFPSQKKQIYKRRHQRVKSQN